MRQSLAPMSQYRYIYCWAHSFGWPVFDQCAITYIHKYCFRLNISLPWKHGVFNIFFSSSLSTWELWESETLTSLYFCHLQTVLLLEPHGTGSFRSASHSAACMTLSSPAFLSLPNSFTSADVEYSINNMCPHRPFVYPFTNWRTSGMMW